MLSPEDQPVSHELLYYVNVTANTTCIIKVRLSVVFLYLMLFCSVFHEGVSVKFCDACVAGSCGSLFRVLWKDTFLKMEHNSKNKQRNVATSVSRKGEKKWRVRTAPARSANERAARSPLDYVCRRNVRKKTRHMKNNGTHLHGQHSSPLIVSSPL